MIEEERESTINDIEKSIPLQQLQNTKDFELRPGLINHGNECFINSIMQCLAVSPFIHSFIEKYMKEDEDMKTKEK